MTSPRPIGQRFSQVYIQRGAPVSDSPRMRARIAALRRQFAENDIALQGMLLRELGCGPKAHLNSSFEIFLSKCEVQDFLDFITILFRRYCLEYDSRKKALWVSNVRRIFDEENMGYTIDDEGGVHYRHDEEFVRNRESSVASLRSARYGAVNDALSKAFRALDGAQPDGKIACRSIFEAVEILFRLMVPSAPRLGTKEAREHLKPVIDRFYGRDVTAQRAIHKMFESFCDWIDGVHFYRHGQGTEEPIQPPISLTILTVSMGASFLRWLAELDQITNGTDVR